MTDENTLNQTVNQTLKPVSRFAPSPTGNIHLGNVRTALFSYLLAKHLHGDFILRCEDTDQERSEESFLQQQQVDLHWLGLEWNAGPDMGSEHGPYRQSQRGAIYAAYYAQLIEKDLVYPCFCTPQELKVMRKLQMQSGKPPRYAGTCSHLSAEEVLQKVERGESSSLRFKVPKNESMNLLDLVVGEKIYQTNDIGDFIIRRSDGTPAFFFCNAIDDSLMGVTHVLRGVDHLTNTPRQLMLLSALNLRAPDYGHISLVVGADGGPLSKRDGSTGVKDLREAGYLPEAIVNHLARLGHHYTNNALMPLSQLGQAFALEHCGRSPSRHDPQQLMHWQKEAVLHATDAELLAWLAAWLEANESYQNANPDIKSRFFQTIKDNIVLPQDAVQWAEQLLADEVKYSEEASVQLSSSAYELFDDLATRVKESGVDNFGQLLKATGNSVGVKGKALFMPTRAALSGETHGPEMQRIASFLGTDKIIQRLHKAAELST